MEERFMSGLGAQGTRLKVHSFSGKKGPDRSDALAESREERSAGRKE
jgi:hypothetical protein